MCERCTHTNTHHPPDPDNVCVSKQVEQKPACWLFKKAVSKTNWQFPTSRWWLPELMDWIPKSLQQSWFTPLILIKRGLEDQQVNTINCSTHGNWEPSLHYGCPCKGNENARVQKSVLIRHTCSKNPGKIRDHYKKEI